MPEVELHIRPRPHIRSTRGDSILFRIPEHKLSVPGLYRKRQLVRYIEYKKELAFLCIELGFTLPSTPFHVIFYLPMPKGWNKRKKAELNMRPHTVMPDIDNLYKALADSLMEHDQVIHDVRMQKVWINDPNGYISIRY